MGKIIIMKFNENVKYDQIFFKFPSKYTNRIGGVHVKMIMAVLLLRLWKISVSDGIENYYVN